MLYVYLLATKLSIKYKSYSLLVLHSRNLAEAVLVCLEYSVFLSSVIRNPFCNVKGVNNIRRPVLIVFVWPRHLAQSLSLCLQKIHEFFFRSDVSYYVTHFNVAEETGEIPVSFYLPDSVNRCPKAHFGHSGIVHDKLHAY